MIEPRAVRNFDVVLVLLAVALVAYGGLLLYSASLNAYPTISMGHPLTKHVIFAFVGMAGVLSETGLSGHHGTSVQFICSDLPRACGVDYPSCGSSAANLRRGAYAIRPRNLPRSNRSKHHAA